MGWRLGFLCTIFHLRQFLCTWSSEVMLSQCFFPCWYWKLNCQTRLEQEDFLPLLQQQRAFASTFPEVATDLSLVSGSECFLPHPKQFLLHMGEGFRNKCDFLPVCHQGWLSQVFCPTSVCLISTWGRLTEIAGKWIWVPLVSKTPRYNSKWLC